MKSLEKLMVITLALVLLLFFFVATKTNSVAQQLDQALFLETIDRAYETGSPTTIMGGSVVQFIRDLVVAPVSKICEYDFENTGGEEVNIYKRHSYLILYPLAAMRTFLSAKNIFYFCAVIAFPGLLFAIYVGARFLGLPVVISTVLTTMVAFHPAWSYSSFGQFYPDKLFPALCVIYFLILHHWITHDRRRPLALLMIGILAASTSERSIIMLVAGTLAVYALFGLRRRWAQLDVVPLVLVILLTGYVYSYMHFVQRNPDYASYSSSFHFFSIISENGEAAKAIYKFLFINMLLLAPFGIFAKRWSLIAFFSMLPNMFGSIAGAEKLGWTTHYHSYYFPFLIVALIVGASSLYRRGSSVVMSLIIVLCIGITLLYVFIDPFPPPNLRFSLNQAEQTGLIKTFELPAAIGPAKTVIEQAKYVADIAAWIPAGSEVTTFESYMPALYEHGVRSIHFYPLGLGRSQYLIVPYMQRDNTLRWVGFVSYLGHEVAEQADSCLQNRINEKYYLVKEFPNSQTTGTAILQRMP